MDNQKSNPLILYTGVAVSFIGVVLSMLLLCKHGFSDLCTSSLGCSIDGVDGCKELGQSSLSKIGPFPIALFGLFYYAFFTAGFVQQSLRARPGLAALLLYAAIAGLIVDIILGYINFTQILVPCILCAYTYLITLALFVITLTHRLQSFRSHSPAADVLKESGTPAVAGSLLTLAVAGILYLMGSPHKTASVDGPIDEALVPGVLADFAALKSVQFQEQGLKSREGSEKGYIVIHKFADFLCPHCLHASQLLQEAMKRWPGRIQIYYRHFPLDSTCNPILTGAPQKPYGDWRCNGAQAAICAADYPEFAAFYHSVFDLQNQRLPITLEHLERLSKDAGIPWNQLRSCMASLATQQKLMRDIDDAKKIDIHSTPTLIVNGRLLPPGVPDRRWFLQLLDSLVYEKEGRAAFDELRARLK
jgi:predicted DsbA family dithiol-disulfide isomerase/uncharacterized membrane protein